MKTNQNMIREDHRFIQRTKDSYFDATTLLESWNLNSEGSKKLLGNYQSNLETKKLVKYLKEHEGIEKPYKASTGKGGTWMCDLMFIDFAMWVSLDFKVQVLKYVRDGLIKSRHDAGNHYNQMCAGIMKRYVEMKGVKPPADLYMKEARMLKSMLGIDGQDRNTLSEEMLSNITHLQKFNTLLISKGIGKASRVKQLNLQVEVMNV